MQLLEIAIVGLLYIRMSFTKTTTISTNASNTDAISRSTTTLSTTTQSDDICKTDGSSFILLVVLIIIVIIILIIMIIDLKIRKTSIFMACAEKGYQRPYQLYVLLMCMVFSCDISIFTLLILGRKCDLIFGLGLGFGLFIFFSCILVSVFIKTACELSEVTYKKPNKMEPRPIHILTQNKVEPETTSMQRNIGPFPQLPPLSLKPRPQSQLPENIYAKDQNYLGLPADNEDAQGLPRVPPFDLNVPVVQEEDVSKRTKKKRKKKKKKGQMNEENQEIEMKELRSRRKGKA